MDAQRAETNNPLSQLQELDAMKAIAAELSKLDEAGVKRVLRWAADAFAAKGSVNAGGLRFDNEPKTNGDAAELKSKYASLADFYGACSPTQENDKALVVGYWVQVLQGAGDFDSQSINKELKNLGHGVANITSAFDSLMARKPQLVIQTKKSGTTRQARKLYKLTVEGQRSVEQMVGGGQE